MTLDVKHVVIEQYNVIEESEIKCYSKYVLRAGLFLCQQVSGLSRLATTQKYKPSQIYILTCHHCQIIQMELTDQGRGVVKGGGGAFNS